MLVATLRDTRWLESLPHDLDIYFQDLNESSANITEDTSDLSSTLTNAQSSEETPNLCNAACDLEKN